MIVWQPQVHRSLLCSLSENGTPTLQTTSLLCRLASRFCQVGALENRETGLHPDWLAFLSWTLWQPTPSLSPSRSGLLGGAPTSEGPSLKPWSQQQPGSKLPPAQVSTCINVFQVLDTLQIALQTSYCDLHSHWLCVKILLESFLPQLLMNSSLSFPDFYIYFSNSVVPTGQ